jgi:hypothetical protein
MKHAMTTNARLSRTFSAVLAAVVLLLSGIVTIGGSTPAGAATNRTPVMGASIMNATQLANWFKAKRAGQAAPRIPALNNDVRALAQVFIDQGAREGVRGDIAFVQSVIETGWFVFPDAGQIRPSFNNFAGIYAFNGRPKGTTCAAETSPSRCFATPQLGVRVQMQLLRGYADALSAKLPDRLILPPADRIGLAPWWEWFGGNSPSGKLIWASAPDYGKTIVQLYSGALMYNRLPPVSGYPDRTPPTALFNPDVASTQSTSPFTVAWWGQDFETGIQAFNVDVSDNGGPWVRWLNAAPMNVNAAQASGSAPFFGVAGHTYSFRLTATDGAKNAAAWTGIESTTVGSGVPKPMPYSSAYAIANTGDLSAVSSVPIAAPRWSASMARGFTTSGKGGAYVLDLYGGTHAIGGAPALPVSAYWPNWDIARGIALNPDGNGGYILDGYGGLHPTGNAAPILHASYWPNWDIARDVILTSTSTATKPAGYVMDAYGGIHPFGAAPPASGSPYWPGQPMARDLVGNPAGPGGWVLDGLGFLHAFSGAPAVSVSASWNWNIARGAWMWNTSSGLRGYTLDGYGAVHGVNGAPAAIVTRYTHGVDTSRWIAIQP